ncbi:MAG: hypothetical protein SV375_17775 [Thermodesulfobacteriota bacterium]|nr:hypothetical protein [Thermodesulfobacteriota bacterium]
MPLKAIANGLELNNPSRFISSYISAAHPSSEQDPNAVCCALTGGKMMVFTNGGQPICRAAHPADDDETANLGVFLER